MEWIDNHKKLPEKYKRVITLLYKQNGYEICVNSIQGRHITEADGNLIDVYQWENENLRVTHWLDGVPTFPNEACLRAKKKK